MLSQRYRRHPGNLIIRRYAAYRRVKGVILSDNSFFYLKLPYPPSKKVDRLAYPAVFENAFSELLFPNFLLAADSFRKTNLSTKPMHDERTNALPFFTINRNDFERSTI
jgi:hypothetical protein